MAKASSRLVREYIMTEIIPPVRTSNPAASPKDAIVVSVVAVKSLCCIAQIVLCHHGHGRSISQQGQWGMGRVQDFNIVAQNAMFGGNKAANCWLRFDRPVLDWRQQDAVHRRRANARLI
jgi:hypothetical protein